MDSSSCRDTALKAFDEMVEWTWRRRREAHSADIPFRWRELHLVVTQSYASKLRVSSSSRLLASAISLNAAVWGDDCSRFDQVVASFTQNLEEFFRVPSSEQLFVRDNTLKKSEIMAAFINFLLQLLHYKVDLIDPFADRIRSDLQRELRFLLALLGDAPFLCDDEQQHVRNFLAELEAVADEVGSLVHSFFFSMEPVAVMIEKIDERLCAVLSHINILKGEVTNLPLVLVTYTSPNAAATVGSFFIVNSLLRDLEDLLSRGDNKVVDVKDQIKILHQKLMFCGSLLKVAPHSKMEEKESSLMQIRDVAYEAEYLINTFLCGDSPLWYFRIRLPQVTHKIELIGTTMSQEMMKDLDNGTPRIAGNPSGQPSLHHDRRSEIEDVVIGFEDKEEEILDQLEGGEKRLQIISIVGMPGLGKTTLAKRLYNRPLISERFDLRSWCVVSNTYRKRGLLADILISSTMKLVGKDAISDMEEVDLMLKIHKGLTGRRYLVIMDDVWSPKVWDDLRACFPDNGNGSRILITSRSKDAMPSSSIIYTLPFLSTDQSLELLGKKVFRNKPFPSKLLGAGKQIAAACHGLPLAVVVVAGVLSAMDQKESAWEKVGENLASYVFDGNGDGNGNGNFMMRTLEHSYKNLPDRLKPCFLYLGSFPEDTNIPLRKLMRLWIAEGFVHKEDNKIAENVAEDYLMELVDKSLVMVSKRRSDGGPKACIVHDLLRDLCLKVAEEENFLKLMNQDYSMYKRHHHQFLDKTDYDSKFQTWRPFGLHLRSFCSSYYLGSPLDVLNMTSLRVLDLSQARGWDGGELDVARLLVHLRYLAIDSIPPSLDSLVNLVYLSVLADDEDVVIPSLIGKMIKLRYLHIRPGAVFDKDFDDGCQIINNVEFLSNVGILELKDEEMLKCWPNLRNLKCRCRPLKVEENETGSSSSTMGYKYRYPDLRSLAQIESLSMSCEKESRVPDPVEVCFPSTITKLTLSGFGLPWEKMSVIGALPNLEVLKLLRDAFWGEEWETREGEFQQLRHLKLQLVYITRWNVGGKEDFPKLQRLVLRGCTHLQEIPSAIGEIETLQSIIVDKGTNALAKSATQIQLDQRDLGSDQLKIFIN